MNAMNANVTYPAHPESLLALRRELIDELKGRLQARQNLTAAAREALDLLKEFPSVTDPQQVARVRDQLDAALRAYEG